jgi:methylmalonyl-CoA epimerase
MARAKRVNHIAIIVDDLEKAMEPYVKGLGLEPTEIEFVESYNTRIVFLPVGDTQIELLQPLGDAGELQEFLKAGGGLHHIAFEVEDVEASIAELEEKGIRMADKTPKPGAQNTLIAFAKRESFSDVLVEIVQPAERE